MNLWTILEALVRRWRIAVPMAILGVVVVVRVYTSIDPTYVASGEVLLAAPTQIEGTAAANPILGTTNALGTAAEAGKALISSSSEAESLADQGFSDYEVEVSAQDPIVLFTSSDPARVRAELTVSRLIDRFGELLIDLQDEVDAPADTYINVVPLQEEPSSVVEASSRLRTTIVAFVASFLAVLVVTLAWDEIRRPLGAAEPRGYTPVQPVDVPVEEDEPPTRPSKPSSRWTRRPSDPETETG